MTLQAILTKPVGEIAALPAAELARLLADAEALKAQAGAVVALIEQALEFRYAGRAKQKRAEHGKDHGAVRFEDNGFEVVATLPKRVKWDQAALRSALDSIEPATAGRIAKVEIKIDERRYEALEPDEKAALSAARTVECGKPSYELKPIEA